VLFWKPLYHRENSPSSSVCGASRIPLSALQPIESYCASLSFSSLVYLQRRSTSDWRERPLLVKGGIMGKKSPTKFSLTNMTSFSVNWIAMKH
jgi:hypothetical protein